MRWIARGRDRRSAPRAATWAPVAAMATIASMAVLPSSVSGAVRLREFGRGISRHAYPDRIVAGPDGNLWFTEFAQDRIARMTPGGTVTEFPLGLGRGREPLAIAPVADGA